MSVILNTSAKSPYLLIEQIFEHLLWARYSTEQNKNPYLYGAYILYLNYVNNFISKSDQLVFHQKVTFPKQPFRSYSYCMYNILGMGSHP